MHQSTVDPLPSTLSVTDPATGRQYLIAVERVRAVDAGWEVTGRVTRPRRYRGNVVTAHVPMQEFASRRTTEQRPA